MSTPQTNLSNADAASSVAPPTSALAHRSMLKTMRTLIQREFWEHRALWVTPLAIAVLLLLFAIPVRIGMVTIGGYRDLFDNVENSRSIFTVLTWGQTLPQYLVMVFVLSFYLLDCLYLERKDRSILFWKSLPVSDAATVISKLFTAIVLVPLGVYLLTLVTSLAASAIWAARVALGPHLPHSVAVHWDTIAWVKVQALMLYGLLVSMAWYAPLAAFLLLVSAWARRSVFLWATLPPVVAIVAERHTFGTHYFGSLLEYRTWGIWEPLGIRVEEPESHGRVVSLADLFDNISMGKAVLNIDLWLGLAVAAAFVFAAIRIRRYRDDT